jgi:hypothetical protein
MSKSLENRQLSRSKIDLFIDCPRCFHAEVALGLPRIGSFPFTLNNAVDHLFKAEFDRYRASREPHPLFATVDLKAVPYQHPQFPTWRTNSKGIRWTDPETGWTLTGAVDDLWQDVDGTLYVADYKATSKAGDITAESLQPAYRRQAEVYQFLVRRQQLVVSDTAWFVYANGIKTGDRFDNRLPFTTVLIPYVGNDDWVLETFRRAVETAVSPSAPPARVGCVWCKFVSQRQSLDVETHSDPLLT